MPTPREDQIKQLVETTKELMKSDSVSLVEFATLIKHIVEFLQKTYLDMKTELLATGKALTAALEKTKNDLQSALDTRFSSYEKRLLDAVTRAETLEAGYTPQKGVDYEDGKDADPMAVAALVLAKLPENREIKSIRADIEDLRQKIKETKVREFKVTSGMGGAAGARSLYRVKDISASLDGVVKTFSIGAFHTILSVDASSHPYALRKTTDYTWDAAAGTITFTSEITASATLAAGQTVVITLVNA